MTQLGEDLAWAKEHFPHETLDPGIVRILRIFKDHGIETCQSCEGGPGHSYEHPTIDVLGEPWKALDIANTYAAQVDTVSEIFGIRDGRPVEHFWRIEFNPCQLQRFRDSWYKPRQERPA
jgi:hypothetical protein